MVEMESVFTLGGLTGGNCEIERLKVTQVLSRTVDSYLRLVLAQRLIPIDAGSAAAVVQSDALIPLVVQLLNEAQVSPSVVNSVSVDVIDRCLG